MNDSLPVAVDDFIVYKRALGRKYLTEQATLRLLLDFADDHGIVGLGELTGPLLERFVASRPRHRARSFNHLVGVLGCFFDWTVVQGRLPVSPLQRVRRRETDERLPFILDITQARQLLDAAAALRDNPRGMGRGAVHHGIFALCRKAPFQGHFLWNSAKWLIKFVANIPHSSGRRDPGKKTPENNASKPRNL